MPELAQEQLLDPLSSNNELCNAFSPRIHCESQDTAACFPDIESKLLNMEAEGIAERQKRLNSERAEQGFFLPGGQNGRGLQLEGPSCLLATKSNQWDQTQKRSLLGSLLKDCFPGAIWIKSHWAFVYAYKRLAQDPWGIRDNRHRRYRVNNYLKCYWKKTGGHVYTKKDDPQKIYRKRIRCQEPGCLDCWEAKRTRQSSEWTATWKNIVTQHREDFLAAYFITYTLPEEIENVFLKDEKLAQKLETGIQNMSRKLFGVSYRSNLFMHIASHPVSGGDLFRDRFHAHSAILPFEIDQKTKEFRWLEPAWKHSEHRKEWPKIDLERLRKEFNALLQELVPGLKTEAINPQVEIVNFGSWARRRKPYLSDLEWWNFCWAKVGHNLEYMMRGFTEDLENTVLQVNQDYVAILKGERKTKGILYWEAIPLCSLTERFKWIKEHNKVSNRGVARKLKHYEDVLQIEQLKEKDVDVDDYIETRATVEIVREKKWDARIKKVIVVRDEIYNWHCPITKTDRQASKRDICPWPGAIRAPDKGG